MEKIEKLKKERKEIIGEFSKKKVQDTYIDKELKKMHEIYHVIVTDIKLETPDVKTFTLSADKDSTPDKMVFNRTVTLKDSWAKLASK